MCVLSPGGAPAIRGHGVTGGTAYAETRPSKPITLKAKLQHVSCLAFAPNGKTLAARVDCEAVSPSGSHDGLVRLWDWPSGRERPLSRIRCHPAPARAASRAWPSPPPVGAVNNRLGQGGGDIRGGRFDTLLPIPDESQAIPSQPLAGARPFRTSGHSGTGRTITDTTRQLGVASP